MDIRQTLGSGQSNRKTLAIVEFINDDAERFAQLMSIFFEGEYRLTQRAAWPISVCAETQPQLLAPYLSKLVGQLHNSAVHGAVRRNIVRLLQYVEIPRRLQGKLYSDCLDFIADPSEAIAVRAFSITVAERIARGRQPLMDELRLVISQNLTGASPGVRARARKILAGDEPVTN